MYFINFLFFLFIIIVNNIDNIENFAKLFSTVIWYSKYCKIAKYKEIRLEIFLFYEIILYNMESHEYAISV